MKTRAQTKVSIRRKQQAVLRSRQRRRQYAVSAAACLLLAFTVWQPFSPIETNTDSASAVREIARMDETDVETAGVLSENAAYETGTTDCCAESSDTSQPTVKGSPARNGGSIADTITVQYPSGKVLLFSADNAARRDTFTRLNDLLTALQTRETALPLPADDAADEASSLVIERSGSEGTVRVTVNGSFARFDDGRQLLLSPQEQQTLRDLLSETE